MRWVALVLIVACKPTAGGKCDDPLKIACTIGAPSALVCAGKHWVSKSCEGGCTQRADPQSGALQTVCADSMTPAIGDACYLEWNARNMPPDESTCSGPPRSGAAILGCHADEGHFGGGYWRVIKTCGPGTQCDRARGVFCTTQ
jgi:hypothetical protein